MFRDPGFLLVMNILNLKKPAPLSVRQETAGRISYFRKRCMS
ncbi:hypothetical protein KIS4809_4730 [Bacillus sp. ZZV12-4809]|nr:hypothetical protein KIS4809_4730 [Bacillus sp. ZZV12-4809]